MKLVVLTDKSIDLKEKIINIPNILNCSMRMTDHGLEQLKQLSKKLILDL